MLVDSSMEKNCHRFDSWRQVQDVKPYLERNEHRDCWLYNHASAAIVKDS